MLIAIIIFVFCISVGIIVITDSLAPNNKRTNKYKNIRNHKNKKND